jgi:1-acyl-sn-glycerol-3-phosphate acyltransferase
LAPAVWGSFTSTCRGSPHPDSHASDATTHPAASDRAHTMKVDHAIVVAPQAAIARGRSPLSKPDRPDHADDLLSDQLSPIARAHIRLVQRSLQPGLFDRALRFGQAALGSTWIDQGTKHLRHVHGLSRVGVFDPAESYICVANHRSFFDLYVVTAHLVKRKLLPHRIMFPVRSTFFYDSPAGILVNGAMSFFAMYPPVFRERKHARLNIASLDECARLVSRPGVFLGLHPEGTRNKDGDPYTLLPAQSGVGRIIHQAKVKVLPVFVNGLSNDLPRQFLDNFTGKGTPIHIVWGAPVELGDLLSRPGGPKTYKAVAERSLEAVRVLGEEERAIRFGSAAPPVP